jgi:hypothetical protein
MSERDEKKPSERPDYFSDFPEEFEQHPDAPSRDLARRKREQSDRAPIVPRSEPQASGDIHQARARTTSASPDPIVPRSEPQASGDIHQAREASGDVHQDSAVARIEAMKQRLRELGKK